MKPLATTRLICPHSSDLRSTYGTTSLALLLTSLFLITPLFAAPKKKNKSGRIGQAMTAPQPEAVLWRNPLDITSRDLFYGPGGQRDAPPVSFTFVKEDRKGSNPKFVVRDSSGIEWTLKLGPEARPETVASRLVWAVGYFANEDYFLAEVHVRNLPLHLHRGQKYVEPGGLLRNVRLKRHLKGEKKVGYWHWRHNRYTGTKELGGLRVMMALINNWDLKDDNTAIYQEKQARGMSVPLRIYMVKDLGSSFGTTGQSWTDPRSKGNPKSYRQSKFISRLTPDYIDFRVPTRPALDYLFDPPEFITDVHEHWIGRRIPRADARWIGQLLARLSPSQIRDAFRSAGYSPQEVEEFAKVVELRIAVLNKL
ncbi:MAG TPA: hypothetical protein VGX94_14205 [Terriglobia bacterium]|nr:hypothetical protein [Terriglobia bacterium]